MDDFIDVTHILTERYCVYILFYREHLQYIGQTTRLETRIGSHKTKGEIPFDKVMVKYCETKEAMDGLEYSYINEHNPPYNVKDLGYSKTRSNPALKFKTKPMHKAFIRLPVAKK